MRNVFVVAFLMALAAGATAPGTAAEPFVEAQRAPVFVIGPSTVPARARPTHARRAAREVVPREALAAANRAARRRPGSGFVGATHFYGYEPGAIFELHASPAYVSTVMLEPGEALVDAAAGDTENWSVANTLSGTGAEARTLVMVKPKAAGLRTNLVLVTDRRTYLVEAISSAGESYSAQIAWRYPQASAPRVAERANATAPIVYNHSYRIRVVRGRRPAWAPVRAYDDGLRTFIEFPENIAASDMPPLFVRTREGAEIVNYRVQGHRYMVDRIFDVAELRLGRAAPVVVRIERRRSSRVGSATEARR